MRKAVISFVMVFKNKNGVTVILSYFYFRIHAFISIHNNVVEQLNKNEF